MSAAESVFKGPVGIAIGYDDPVLVVKKVLEFAKTNEKIRVKGAVVEGKLCEPAEVKEIAELPSREVLLSMVAGAFQAPTSARWPGLLPRQSAVSPMHCRRLKRKKVSVDSAESGEEHSTKLHVH